MAAAIVPAAVTAMVSIIIVSHIPVAIVPMAAIVPAIAIVVPMSAIVVVAAVTTAVILCQRGAACQHQRYTTRGGQTQ
jgi:hypothetical protein